MNKTDRTFDEWDQGREPLLGGRPVSSVLLDEPISWQDAGSIMLGAKLELSENAWSRVGLASQIVTSIVASGRRAYGITTGVGALSDTLVGRDAQQRLSRNIIFSHACGVGELLSSWQVRAIITAQIINFSHGRSGVRPQIVHHMLALLANDCLPEVPSKGSVGYITHNAHIALVLIGEGWAQLNGRRLSGAEALKAIDLEPIVLGAKEGLSLVNGSGCATGLLTLALTRTQRLLNWADAIAALTLEAAGSQLSAFGEEVLGLRRSEGIRTVGEYLRNALGDSALLAASSGKRTQDALSLRAVPHMHGAARDVFAETARVVNCELASVSDNPVIFGTPEAPDVVSEAHAVCPGLAHAADSLGIVLTQMSGMSERRIDRLVNPLVNGLPPFLSADAGSKSGFMIAQYTAVGLSNHNRRLAAPASTDGGVTSGQQEDFLAHATAAAKKLHAIIDNTEYILAIELLAAAQAHDFLESVAARAAMTEALFRRVRAQIPTFADDRPLSQDIERGRDLLRLLDPIS